MKIYITLFTTLIATGRLTGISAAADASASVDRSHPHLRALLQAGCTVDRECPEGYSCSVGKCVGYSCASGQCNSAGVGCYSDTTCEPKPDPGQCASCRSNDNFGPGDSAFKLADAPASAPVDMIEEEEVEEEEEEVDAVQDNEDEDVMKASSLRASAILVKEE